MTSNVVLLSYKLSLKREKKKEEKRKKVALEKCLRIIWRFFVKCVLAHLLSSTLREPCTVLTGPRYSLFSEYNITTTGCSSPAPPKKILDFHW